MKSHPHIRTGGPVVRSTRFALAATAVGIAFLLLAPSAQAFLVPKYEFQSDIPALTLTAKKTPGGTSTKINFTMVTGAYHGEGSLAGAFALINGDVGGTILNTERIEVINTEDQAGAVGRFARGECQSAAACAVERTFNAGVLTLDANATIILYSEKTLIHHNVTSPFGIGVFVNASQALKSGPLGNVPLTHSLLVVGDTVTLTGSISTSTDTLYAILGNPNSTVRVNDSFGSHSYKGVQYLFRFYGTPTFAMQGAGVGTPFINGTQGVFRRTNIDDLKEGFRPEVLNEATRALGGRDILLKPLADGLRDLAPILNGVLVGRAVNPIVNNETANSTDLGIVRFASGTLAPHNSSARMTANTEFILLGDKGFYTDQESVDLGFMSFPPFSLLLWVIAAAAIILGFVLRPMLASAQPGAFGGIRLLAWIFHGLALVIAVILWDQEIKNFLGTSFLTIWTDGAFGKGIILTITLFLEVMSFLVASLLFGMPIRFIVNSGLKLGGLKKARGVGKGIGNLATWSIGAPFIPFVLNGFVGLLIDSLQKSLGGG